MWRTVITAHLDADLGRHRRRERGTARVEDVRLDRSVGLRHDLHPAVLDEEHGSTVARSHGKRGGRDLDTCLRVAPAGANERQRHHDQHLKFVHLQTLPRIALRHVSLAGEFGRLHRWPPPLMHATPRLR